MCNLDLIFPKDMTAYKDLVQFITFVSWHLSSAYSVMVCTMQEQMLVWPFVFYPNRLWKSECWTVCACIILWTSNNDLNLAFTTRSADHYNLFPAPLSLRPWFLMGEMWNPPLGSGLSLCSGRGVHVSGCCSQVLVGRSRRWMDGFADLQYED